MIKDYQKYCTFKHDLSSGIYLTISQVLRDLDFVQLLFSLFVFLKTSRTFCEVLSISRQVNSCLAFIYTFILSLGYLL